MKVAVVGSRGLCVDLEQYIPKDASEIITGGARGIDTLAEQYAKKHSLPLTIFKPDFSAFGKTAYLIRNDQIIREADCIIAIWDGVSRGTLYVITQARKLEKPLYLHIISN